MAQTALEGDRIKLKRNGKFIYFVDIRVHNPVKSMEL